MDFTLSIDVLVTAGVAEPYQRIAARAMRRALIKLELKEVISFEIISAQSHPGSTLLSAEQIIVSAFQAGQQRGLSPGQLDIGAVLAGLVARWETARQNRLQLLITEHDYGAVIDGKPEEYVFGVSRAPAAATVSTYRFERHADPRTRLPLFELLLTHEIGHLLGAPNDDVRSDLVNYFGPHCTQSGCVMQQRDDLDGFERDLLPSFRKGPVFCDSCRQDILSYVEEIRTA